MKFLILCLATIASSSFGGNGSTVHQGTDPGDAWVIGHDKLEEIKLSLKSQSFITINGIEFKPEILEGKLYRYSLKARVKGSEKSREITIRVAPFEND